VSVVYVYFPSECSYDKVITGSSLQVSASRANTHTHSHTRARGSVLPSQWTLISGYYSNNTTSIHTYKARTPFENRMCHNLHIVGQ